MRVLVIHGPNLNLLGEREPEIYGMQTLAQIDESVEMLAKELHVEVQFVQHNSEGAIIDELHSAPQSNDAVVINPGAYSHYSYAIADAVSAIRIPVVEAHLTNVAAREPHRRISVVAAACAGSIAGFGADSYTLALRAAIALARR
ncbi:MAG TPA: type II 3-dehydroquinate dehydratase [Candidatus Baltobacteraceae bacterium]|nr:type II 3-dehydroquinate dehydratase [Candidatus Baltobacteraceae bacterium]